MKDRFSRLLAACETLTRDETAALAGRDLTMLSRTREAKSAILADLALEAGRANAAGSSDTRARLTQLLEWNRENSRRLATLKAATTEKLRKVQAAGNRLQFLRSTYTIGERPEQGFSAHG
jgi:hypothetical protein